MGRVTPGKEKNQSVTNSPVPLTSAVVVRSLSPTEADKHLPVRLRGVITFHDHAANKFFFQDRTGGIYLNNMGLGYDVVDGDDVQVEGTSAAGDFAPLLEVENFRVFGKSPMPPSRGHFQKLK